MRESDLPPVVEGESGLTGDQAGRGDGEALPVPELASEVLPVPELVLEEIGSSGGEAETEGNAKKITRRLIEADKSNESTADKIIRRLREAEVRAAQDPDAVQKGIIDRLRRID